MVIYVIAKRQAKGLPSMDDTLGAEFFVGYDQAATALRDLPPELVDGFAVFSVSAIVQQEVTFEVPF
jgi:hypothetical protein